MKPHQTSDGILWLVIVIPFLLLLLFLIFRFLIEQDEPRLQSTAAPYSIERGNRHFSSS